MKKDTRLIKLGERVASIRESKGLTKYALAKKMGKPYQSILRIETGRINATYLYLDDVAKAFDMDLVEMLKGL